MNQPWYDRFLDKIVLACKGLLLAFLATVMVQALTAYPDAEFLMKSQSKIMLSALVVAMTVFLFLLLGGMYFLLGKVSERILKVICVLAPCILLAGQLLFLLYYRSLYMWDSAYVVGGASALLEQGGVAKEAVYYFSIYPNQNMYAVFTEAILWIAGMLGLSSGGSLMLCNVINMIALDASIIFALLIWRKIRPECSLATWAFIWLVIIMQPFFYMGVCYYYTITLSLPFLMAAIYLVIVLFAPGEIEREYTYKNMKDYDMVKHSVWVIAMSVIAGVCFAIGYLFRATTMIGLVAMICCAFLAPRFKEAERVDKKRSRKLLIALMISLSFSVVVLISQSMMRDEIGIDTKNTAFPATHWMMMSLTSPGCHNAEDEAYTASFATQEEKKDAVLLRAKEKLSNLGATGYFLLVLDKIRNTWASGANSYVLFMENCVRMNGFYPYLFGNHKDFMILYQQGMHMLILIGIVLSVWYQITQKDNKERDSFLLQLVLLGGFLFYILWETSGQYSLPFFLIMLILAFDGYSVWLKGKNYLPYRVEFLFSQENHLDKQKENRLIYRILTVAGACSLLAVLFFFVKNYSLFTKQTDNYKAPVVNQLIANGETNEKMEDIVQTFRTGDSFNQLIFQWRNPVGENNNSVYEVSLLDSEKNTLWTQQIDAKGQGYTGAFLYDFEMITPQSEEEFTLLIHKKTGSEEEYLQFVKYSCGSYDPYPVGDFAIGGESESGDLLLQVARVETKSYTTVKKYILFAGVCMMFFLFLEICCILKLYAVMPKRQNKD